MKFMTSQPKLKDLKNFLLNSKAFESVKRLAKKSINIFVGIITHFATHHI